MIYLEAWIHSPFARALGWSLLHFLWEGVLIALLTAALLFLFRRESARLRYGVACAALLAMPVVVGVTVAFSTPEMITPKLPARIDLSAAGSLSTVQSIPEPPHSLSSRVMPWVAPLWVAGVLIFYLRSLGSWLIALRVKRVGVCAASSEWQSRLRILRARVRVAKSVALLESCLVEVPVVIGFLRPVILMPVSLMAGLSANQLESILIHELAHIRRWDYVVNLLQNVVEGLLFYHPAVWWVSNQIRAERENCCDDVVVSLQGNAREYAAALATLEQSRWPRREPALAATGGSLMKRIRRLLQEPQRTRTSAAPTFVVGLLVVSAGVAAAGWQIKPNTDLKAASIAAPASMASQIAGSAVPLNTRALALIARAETPQYRSSQEVTQSTGQVGQEKLWKLVRELHNDTNEKFSGLQKLYDQAQVSQATQNQEKLEDTATPANRKYATGMFYTRSPYQKWLTEDVAYIISDQERSTYKRLQTDEESEHFIEQFWLRRDPTPGTPQNEMKDEHYRRIAYVNAHFASQIPGWKTDRGRIYITYGPPDEIDSHPSGGSYQPGFGSPITTVPFERWTYRFIQDVGTNVVIEFVDPNRTGEYRMTHDPSEKEVSNGVRTRAGATVQVLGTPTSDGKAVMISVPLNMFGTHKVELIGTITKIGAASLRDQKLSNLNDAIAEQKATLAATRKTYSENHPDVVRLQAQIASLEADQASLQRDPNQIYRGNPEFQGAATTTISGTEEQRPLTIHRLAETPTSVDTRIVSLKPGTYHIKVMVRDIETGALAFDDIDLEVK